MRPIRDLTRMVTVPFTALFVTATCWLINSMTAPAHRWWHWVALGMGIATVVAVGRGLRTLLVLGLVWWVGRELLRRYGPSIRSAFDAWVAREEPRWTEVVRAWQAPAAVLPQAGAGPAVHH